MPQWEKIFSAWNVPVTRLVKGFTRNKDFLDIFNAPGPQAFLVPVDPKQTYFPKISSRVTVSGSMESNPLHLMSPELSPEIYSQVARYFA